MTKAEIWDIIVSKTDRRDRDRLRLLEHSNPETWIANLAAAATAHLDNIHPAVPFIGAPTYARARR